jgi:hypothetical protein
MAGFLVRPHESYSNSFAKAVMSIYINESIGLEYLAVEVREGLERLMKIM